MRTILYLDFDGVINRLSSPAWYDALKSEDSLDELYGNYVQETLTNESVRSSVNYSHKLVQDLKDIKADFDVEIVWLNSLEQNSNLINHVIGIQGDRHLSWGADKHYSSHYLQDQAKYEALKREHTSGAPLIWVDASAVQYFREQDFSVRKSFTIMPEPKIGLTPLGVRRMRDFLDLEKKRTLFKESIPDWFDEEWDALLA